MKWAAPVLNWKSIQYVPAGSTSDGDIVRVFLQILLVVPGAVPGGGTALLKMRNIDASVDAVRRFVVVSPNTTLLPLASGGPFHIRMLPEVNGLVVPVKPV
jgi:hypothetical protein